MQADQRYCLRFGDARGAVLAQRPGHDEVGTVADPQRVGIEQRGVVVHDFAQRLGQGHDITRGQPPLTVRGLQELLRVRSYRIRRETGTLPERDQVRGNPENHLMAAAAQLHTQHHQGLRIATGSSRHQRDPHSKPPQNGHICPASKA